MTATDETTAPSSCVQNNNNKKTISIVFVHLDLGIGGAEQLLLQLASASNSCENTDSIQIFTTRCDPQHCFALVKPPDGALYHSVQVRGAWIPHDVFGKFRVVCSTLRVLYLTTIVLCGKQPNVIVVDVLPTPLLLFKYLSPSALLYYCHYPDALLKKSTTTTGTLAAKSKWHTRWYQSIMLRAETAGMTAADVIAVNSQFTETVVHDTFPLLQQDLSVLYPALDASCLSTSNTKTNCILSLNRFERKKNIELVLHGCAWIRKESKHVELPTIVLCGGYDPRNVENVQYQAELQQLACELQLQVEFKLSAADEERAQLLAQSLVVVYTPDREHFGIVPLEAMYSGTPVIAVNSGGPMETIVDGVTGFLCDNTPRAFGHAIALFIKDPQRAAEMGQAGRRHVRARFGQERLSREWQTLVETSVRQRQLRAYPYERVVQRFLCVFLVLVVVMVVGSVGIVGTMVVLRMSALLGQVKVAGEL